MIELEIASKYNGMVEDCGNCKYFYTNGWNAPSGQCERFPLWDGQVCMEQSCFPEYATICVDFERRDEWDEYL